MFKARFKKYWCDYCYEYVTIETQCLNEILEYAYSVHKNSYYPQVSKFSCSGNRGSWSAYLETSNSLPKRYGRRGAMWLEQITYFNGAEEVIIFSQCDEYISPKASIAFDEFEKIAKQRDANKNFGDF